MFRFSDPASHTSLSSFASQIWRLQSFWHILTWFPTLFHSFNSIFLLNLLFKVTWSEANAKPVILPYSSTAETLNFLNFQWFENTSSYIKSINFCKSGYKKYGGKIVISFINFISFQIFYQKKKKKYPAFAVPFLVHLFCLFLYFGKITIINFKFPFHQPSPVFSCF